MPEFRKRAGDVKEKLKKVGGWPELTKGRYENFYNKNVREVYSDKLKQNEDLVEKMIEQHGYTFPEHAEEMGEVLQKIAAFYGTVRELENEFGLEAISGTLLKRLIKEEGIEGVPKSLLKKAIGPGIGKEMWKLAEGEVKGRFGLVAPEGLEGFVKRPEEEVPGKRTLEEKLVGLTEVPRKLISKKRERLEEEYPEALKRAEEGLEKLRTGVESEVGRLEVGEALEDAEGEIERRKLYVRGKPPVKEFREAMIRLRYLRNLLLSDRMDRMLKELAPETRERIEKQFQDMEESVAAEAKKKKIKRGTIEYQLMETKEKYNRLKPAMPKLLVETVGWDFAEILRREGGAYPALVNAIREGNSERIARALSKLPEEKQGIWLEKLQVFKPSLVSGIEEVEPAEIERPELPEIKPPTVSIPILKKPGKFEFPGLPAYDKSREERYMEEVKNHLRAGFLKIMPEAQEEVIEDKIKDFLTNTMKGLDVSKDVETFFRNMARVGLNKRQLPKEVIMGALMYRKKMLKDKGAGDEKVGKSLEFLNDWLNLAREGNPDNLVPNDLFKVFDEKGIKGGGLTAQTALPFLKNMKAGVEETKKEVEWAAPEVPEITPEVFDRLTKMGELPRKELAQAAVAVEEKGAGISLELKDGDWANLIETASRGPILAKIIGTFEKQGIELTEENVDKYIGSVKEPGAMGLPKPPEDIREKYKIREDEDVLGKYRDILAEEIKKRSRSRTEER